MSVNKGPVYRTYSPFIMPTYGYGNPWIPNLYKITEQSKSIGIVFMYSDAVSVTAANRIPVNHVDGSDVTVGGVDWKSATNSYWYNNSPLWACIGYEHPVNGLEYIWQLPYPLSGFASGGAAGGDLSGTYPNPSVSEAAVTQHESALTITISQISDLPSYSLASHTHALNDLTDVTESAAANRHVLVNNGSGQYVNRLLVEADISDFGSYAAASHNHILSEITDAGALAALDTVSTSEIDDDAVTFAKIQNIAQNSIMGRVSSGSGSFEELSVSQLQALIGTSIISTTSLAQAFGATSILNFDRGNSNSKLIIVFGFVRVETNASNGADIYIRSSSSTISTVLGGTQREVSNVKGEGNSTEVQKFILAAFTSTHQHIAITASASGGSSIVGDAKLVIIEI